MGGNQEPRLKLGQGQPWLRNKTAGVQVLQMKRSQRNPFYLPTQNQWKVEQNISAEALQVS